jgi:hypothetical protein
MPTLEALVSTGEVRVILIAALAGALAVLAFRRRASKRAPQGAAGPLGAPRELGPLARAVRAAVLQGPARGATIAERVRRMPEYSDLPSVAVYPRLKYLVEHGLIRSFIVNPPSGASQGEACRYYTAGIASVQDAQEAAALECLEVKVGGEWLPSVPNGRAASARTSAEPASDMVYLSRGRQGASRDE